MATVTATVTSVLTSVLTTTTSSATASSTSRASPQGGIFEGVLPNKYNASNPILLFIIQAGIIIIFCRLLHYPLSLLGQPRVIAEVIGGILLGPSVLMRIPGFQNAIFPTASIPVLSNVANLGLILFLFSIALEVDMRLFTSNWRVALSVGLAGMILPFGLGCAIAWGLFNQFHNDGTTVPINFGVYALFIGTALAITAFPVLCRILSELNLLRSPVGVTVLAAGVGNDVVGWILLALCVALVNNSSGLAALWVLLVCVGWTLFLIFAVRPVFHWALKRTGSIQNGPTQFMVAVTMLLVLTSAFFTGMIGVHPIFGAFLVGLICPHDGGFAIKLTEKIEDLIGVLFLPLYFASSGLSTNLGLLNDGITWAYVIGVIAVAFAGKIIGGTLAAKAMKMVWRESFTIGCLMSCKGLVELIVLNIGLQAKILSTRTFTIFVVMALVTTIATTPLTKALYPPWYQKKIEQWKRGEIDWDGKPLESGGTSHSEVQRLQDMKIRRLLVYLRLDSLPSLFTFVSLLGRNAKPEMAGDKEAAEHPTAKPRPLEIHALRMLELTQRTSSVMKITEAEEYAQRDPVLNAFRTFSQLNDVAVSGNVVVAPEDAYAQTVVDQATEQESDFVLIPWSEVGSNTEDQSVPFKVSDQDRFTGRQHLDFIQNALTNAVCNTGIFISKNFSGASSAENVHPGISRRLSIVSMRSSKGPVHAPIADKTHHVFFPFIGGVDDRVALRFVLQLAKNPHVTATIVNLSLPDHDEEYTVLSEAQASGAAGTDHKLAINTEITAQDTSLISALQQSLPEDIAARVTFIEKSVKTTTLVGAATELAHEKVGQNLRNAGDLIIVGRRHPKLKSLLRAPSQSITDYEMGNIIGVLGEKMAVNGLKASVLVVQAAGPGLEW